MSAIESGQFAGFELVDTYSRRQALADGMLVDVSELAREAGFRWPVAVSARVFYEVLAPWAARADSGDMSKPRPGQPLYGYCQDFRGRAWDMLSVMLRAIRLGGGGGRVDFSPLFVLPEKGQRPVAVALYSTAGPGDDGEPVITVMLPDED